VAAVITRNDSDEVVDASAGKREKAVSKLDPADSWFYLNCGSESFCFSWPKNDPFIFSKHRFIIAENVSGQQ